MLQLLSDPLQTGVRLHRRALRRAFPNDLGGRMGKRRAYHVPPLSLCGLGRVSSPVVQQLRHGSSEPMDLTTYLLVQAVQHLALGLCDDDCERFT